MPKLAPLKIEPQKDVLTFEDSKQRMVNWRNLMSAFYDKETGNIPKGVFIPFEDFAELAKLQEEVKSITYEGTDEKKDICIVGARGYFTFPLPEEIPINMKASDYPVQLILVPVYQLKKTGTSA